MKYLDKLTKHELKKLIPREIFELIPLEYFNTLSSEHLRYCIRELKDQRVFSKLISENEIDVEDFQINFDLSDEIEVQKKFYELLDFQYYIRSQALQRLKNENKLLIHMPTGTGKTKTTCHILSDLINNKQDAKVLWVAHEEILVDQAMEEFKHVFSRLGRKKINIVHYKEKSTNKLDKNEILFITYQTLDKINSSYETINADIIIADECHKILAETYSHGIHMATNSDTKLIGLSATPGRKLENNEENERLSREFDFQKLEIDIDIIKNFTKDNKNYSSLFDYLYEKKILAKPRFKQIGYETRDNLFIGRDNIINSDKKINNMLEKDSNRNFAIAKEVFSIVQENKKIMVFASSVNQSIAIAFLINSFGEKVSVVNGNMTKKDEKINMNNFISRKTRILIVVNKLTTGFDDPKIDCVYIARNTSSLLLFSQMIGRGLRGEMMGGTNECLVYHMKRYSIFEDTNEMFSYFDKNYE